MSYIQLLLKQQRREIDGGGMLDFDAWKKQQRENRRAALHATCTHCNENILDALEESACESGYGSKSSSTIFECPHCRKELEFELGWELCSAWPAEPVMEELKL